MNIEYLIDRNDSKTSVELLDSIGKSNKRDLLQIVRIEMLATNNDLLPLKLQKHWIDQTFAEFQLAVEMGFRFYFVREGKEIASFVGCIREHNGNWLILSLATRPESQKRGHATKLLNHIKKEASKKPVFLRVSSERRRPYGPEELVRFYAKRGFVVTKTFPSGVGGKEGDVVMSFQE